MQHTVSAEYTNPELDWVGNGKLIFITVHRRENIGEPMRHMFKVIAIQGVIDEHLEGKSIYPIHMNPVVRKVADEELGDCSQIHVIDPIEVFDCHNFEARCPFVLQIQAEYRKNAHHMASLYWLCVIQQNARKVLQPAH